MPKIELTEQEKAQLFKLNRKQAAAYLAIFKAIERARRAELLIYITVDAELAALNHRKIKDARSNDWNEFDDAQYVEIQATDNPYSFHVGITTVDMEGMKLILQNEE